MSFNFEVGETVRVPVPGQAFVIQPAAADALPYVLKTWGRYVENNLEATPRHGFLHDFAQVQAQIIRRSHVLCAMQGDRIAAFCVYEPMRGTIWHDRGQEIAGELSLGVLHWITTREKRRQQGAARALLAAAGLTKDTTEISAWTSSLRHLGLATAPYTPFWLRSL